MKVLITGSAGFIGSALALQLLQRGDEVIGIAPVMPVQPGRIAETHQGDRYTLTSP